MAKTDKAVPALIPNKKLDDIVNWSATNCYYYKVDRDEEDISVQLNLYSGLAYMFANGGSIPKISQDSHFNTSATSNAQTLELTKEEREEIRHANGDYYICVHGQMTSTYTLTVRPQTKKSNYFMLEDGYAETFKIHSNKMQIFVYRTPDLEYVNEDISLNFEVQASAGPLPKLFGKFCTKQNYRECTEGFNIDDLNNGKKGFEKA